MAIKPKISVASRFFSGMAEFAFHQKLGVADSNLTDYVSNLLLRFLRCDGIYRQRNPRGERLVEVSEMLAEAQLRIGSAQREMYQHIGDVTLFWAGVYPESLKRLQAAGKKDHFIDYCEQGKRSYLLASQIPTEDDSVESGVLAQLSQQFELCAYGLSEVRREWERAKDEDNMVGLLLD